MMRHIVRFSACLIVYLYSHPCTAQDSSKLLYKNNSFELYSDKVIQDKFTGQALSATKLVSDYKSRANAYQSAAINFKFSINGKDNEMKPGTDHHVNAIATAKDGSVITPVIKFGQQYNDPHTLPDNTYLKPQTRFTIRLDMRDVLKAFDKTGYYTTFNGDKIYKQDFKGVYVAGSAAPLSWDFDNLVNNPKLLMKDEDKDGIYETTLILNNQEDERQTSSSWELSKDISAFPQYQSTYPISDAIYNMSLQEMEKAVEPDSTFRTGKEWAGVWTRDISYSIILSMAYLQPRVAMNSLLRKVKNGKIIQDTGTGGAYPASTDRMIWAVAAWELFKVTGDKEWLKQSYQIIKNSIEQDMDVAYDKTTGLIRGESSFLDWREQTYPKWMQPADIFESECLGTNAVHYEANIVLANMATLLKDPATAAKHKKIAAGIKAGINNYLWINEKGYYAQFRYGRHAKMQSLRSEALGEALTVLFDIASEKQAEVVRRTPVMEYGIPCIFPQIPNIPPYHNNAVWPFVQTYWAMASAKAGNETSVMQSIAAIYRPAALWLTNKENFVAETGDYAGTQINSDNMLWSLSGNLALVYKILFGIHFNESNISFQPFVPQAMEGKRSLTNFHYRGAIYDIDMEGYGNTIKSFMLDGKIHPATIAATATGHHTIKIILVNKQMQQSATHIVIPYVSLPAPQVILDKDKLMWNNIAGDSTYLVFKDGKEIQTSIENSLTIDTTIYGEYQVIALDQNNIRSFASEPIMVSGATQPIIYEMEDSIAPADLPYKGFSGNGFIETSTTINTNISISIAIPEDGNYAIDFRYANGNGPTNTENKCAIRTLKENGRSLGTIILPQRGKDEWSNWGWSNSILTTFTKGTHILTISLDPHDENMNGEINQAMLDNVRVVSLK